MISIIHQPCDGIVFYYEHKPIPGETFDVEHAFDPSGTPLTWGASRICPNCGELIETADLRPGPPPLRTFRMNSSEDMRELYKAVNINHFDGIA
jgi:hypothetical protein